MAQLIRYSGNPVRYIGERVRYYSVANGWMFGTVADVQPATGPGTLETATVYFPGHSGYRPYPTTTTTLASFLLERTSDNPEPYQGFSADD